MAELGSQSYGNPVVAGGMVFVGTNNELVRDPDQPGDRGVLMAFDEKTGEFHVAADARQARVGTRQRLAVPGRRLVAAGRGRAALLREQPRGARSVSTSRGFRDNENDGPFKDEKLTGQLDADVIWALDMMEEVGTYPHNLANSSPVVHGRPDLRQHLERPGREPRQHPVAARAVDHRGQQDRPASSCGRTTRCTESILHGQWSTPSVGTIGGVLQVVSAQGDGWVRGYEAQTGKKLWEFDTNPKDSVWPRTRNEVISTPVIYENVVYIPNGQDPEHGEGVGHFYAIDATKRGDITKTGLIWHYDKIRRSISTPAVADGLVYISDFSGYLHCLDAKTGQAYWTHDMLAAIWGSPFLVDGKRLPG